MVDFLKRAAFVGLGAFAMTKEKVEQLAEEMVKKGEISSEEGRKLVEELLARGKDQGENIQKAIRDEVARLKTDFGLVSKREYEALEARVRELERRLQAGDGEN